MYVQKNFRSILKGLNVIHRLQLHVFFLIIAIFWIYKCYSTLYMGSLPQKDFQYVARNMTVALKCIGN